MKKAEGKYVGVRAITREEAVEMAPEIFEVGEKMEELWAEGNKFWLEKDRLWKEGHKPRARGYKLRAEANKLWAEGDILWAELAIKLQGFIPDYRTMNFIAADRDDMVYSFVWTREEIWVYGGEKCPSRDTVEKVEWRKG